MLKLVMYKLFFSDLSCVNNATCFLWHHYLLPSAPERPKKQTAGEVADIN